MFALLRSVVNFALGSLLKTGVVKWGVMFGAMFLVTGLLTIVLELAIPAGGTSALTQVFANIPASVWYFMDLFQIGFGLPLVLGAYVTRFIIRRLPIIG